MADAAAAAAEEKAPVKAASPGLPVKLLIIVGLVALVVGVGSAILAVKLLGGGNKGSESVEEHKRDASAKAEGEPESGEKQAQAAKPGVMFDLDPFIVNLADQPEIRYLKIVVKLEVENELVAADLSARVAQVRDTVLVLLSSKDVNSVRTPQGKFQLRDEITQRVNGLLPKPSVRAAYFTDFVVQ